MSMQNPREIREQVLKTAQAMNPAGINSGASGNVSARAPGGFIITPTGLAYEACQPEDMVFVGLDGLCSDLRKPSSEWRFHRDIYACRPEAGAVVHAHPRFSIALACQELDIPPFHYMIASFGGVDVRCARYALFGSQELSEAVLEALEDRKACLMSHHGLLALGSSLDQALRLAVQLEEMAEQYWRVLQIGPPRLLSSQEMAAVLEKFSGYGQQ